ncbi:MAG: MDR family oxidoreductase [Mesorhizobium sp.]
MKHKSDEPFTALVLEAEGRTQTARFRSLTAADLPDHDTLVQVSFSTMNYKDGLAVSGKGRIARRLPMVAGIDLMGTIVETRSADWKPGDKVIVNGWGMSETEWGGYSRYQRVKSDWLVRLPDTLTEVEAMAIGTAGYTAALCVDALEDWGVVKPGTGEVLVTGAAGGVGSVTISLLSKAGYQVTAATRRPETHGYLAELGATSFVDQPSLAEKGGPLQKERWSGAVDSIGSVTLANVLSQTVYGGAVAACGLAGGADLPGTVLPHILRGVTLIGIDSVFAPLAKRERAWARLAADLDRSKLARIMRVEPFAKVPELANEILDGKIRGRVVIDMSGEGL